MGNLIQTMGSTKLSFLQIITIAYIGALIGESQREVEDTKDIVLRKFISSWVSSGFLGTIVGLLAREFLFKDKPLAVLSFAGYFGYVGNKKSNVFLTALTNKLSNMNSKDKEDKPNAEDNEEDSNKDKKNKKKK